MKFTSVHSSVIGQLLAAACITSSAYAATATKTATGTDLTSAASWTGGSGPGFPTSEDVATWDFTSLGAGLTAATDVTWGSINASGAMAGSISISGAGKINTGDITLAGAQTLGIANDIILSGNSNFHIADVTASTAADFTILNPGILSGDFGITKSGAGTLRLFGASTHTGGTTLNGGVLLLDYTLLNNSKLASGSALTLGGGGLTLSGHSTQATTQSVASTTLNQGSATITLAKTTVANVALTLNLNTITRNAGGTMNVVYPASTSLGASATTTTPNDATGILGTWASVATGTTATRYATVSGGSIASYTGTFAGNAAELTDATGTVNYDLADASGTVQDTVSANTIRYAGAAGTTTPGGTSFTVNGLMNAGTGLWTIGTDPLTIGASQELVVNTANNGIALSSGIANNGLGASALTKTGTGTLTLSGANTYTGPTNITAGTLNLANTDSLYSSNTASWTKENISVNLGATLALNAGADGEFTGSDLTTLFSNLTTSIDNNGLKAGSAVNLNVAATSSVSTTLPDSTGTGGGTIHLTKTGAGTLDLLDSTFSGNFTASGGVTTITGASTLIGGTGNASLTWNSCAVRQSAGTLKLVDLGNASNVAVGAGIASFIMGSTASNYASYELSGGTLLAVNPWRFNPRNAQMTQTGGAIDISYTGNGTALGNARQFIIGSGTLRGVIYATGGTATITTTNVAATRAALNVSDTTGTSAGTTGLGGGELTLADTANWSLSGPAGYVAVTREGAAATKLGHLNLNGNSVLTANKVVKGSGTARINFDGGTLRAAENNTAFLTGLDSARIYSGGAKIDTNGKNVTIDQALTNPSGNVVTSIPVATPGSGYTGAPIVSISDSVGTGATAVADYDPTTGTVTSITITNPGSDYTSAPTVAISGGNGSGATLGAATIDVAPNTGGLTKLGAGTLTLNSASTYAGGTTVEAGTLLVTNSIDSATGTGSVTVKSTATFGGTGIVSGIVNLESGGTLAPGASIGLLDTGALTLPAGATLAAEIDSSTSTADGVNVTGALTLGGALNVTDIAETPAEITPGTKLTLITYSGGLSGTFADKAEGSTFPAGGNIFKISYADAGKVTLEAMGAAPGYSGWASTNAPAQSDALDHDNDGVSNGVEYVVGGLATTNDASKLPTLSTANGNFVFSFVRDQDSKTPDTAVSIQVGTTLADWPDTYPVPNAGVLGPVEVINNGDGTDTVTLTLVGLPDAKKFARLNVIITP